MIDSSIALQCIEALSPSELRKKFDDAFLCGKSLAKGSRWVEEPPEDVFISALKADDISIEAQATILGGCSDLYNQFFACLTSGLGEVEKTESDSYIRLCRLVDFSAPEELEATAKAIFKLAFERSDVDIQLLGSIVRAVMSFEQNSSDIPIWESAIKREPLAAYAFNALLEIEPNHPRMKRHLIRLWQRASKGWKINVIFLTRRLSNAQDSNQTVYHVLRDIEKKFPEFWKIAKEKLSQISWGKEWLLEMQNSDRRILLSGYRIRGFDTSKLPPLFSDSPVKRIAQLSDSLYVNWLSDKRDEAFEALGSQKPVTYSRYEAASLSEDEQWIGMAYKIRKDDFDAKKTINNKFNEIENDLVADGRRMINRFDDVEEEVCDVA